MAQDLTDTDALTVGESTENSDQPNGAREEAEGYIFTESTMVVIDDGLWDLCPPYDVELVQGLATVASCGNHGYEQPTQALRISTTHGDDDAMQPYYEFILYDGNHTVINLDDYDLVTFEVADTAGPHTWTRVCEVIDGPAGQLQTKLLPAAGADPGMYQGRFVLYSGLLNNLTTVWTDPFTQANGVLTPTGDMTDLAEVDATKWWKTTGTTAPLVGSNHITWGVLKHIWRRTTSDLNMVVSGYLEQRTPSVGAYTKLGFSDEDGNLAFMQTIGDPLDSAFSNLSLTNVDGETLELGHLSGDATYTLVYLGGLLVMFDATNVLVATLDSGFDTAPPLIYAAGTGGVALLDDVTASIYASGPATRSVPIRPIELEVIF